MLLAVLILVPLVFAGLVAVSPARQAKGLSLLGTLIPVALFLYIAGRFGWATGQHDQLDFLVGGRPLIWFAPLGLEVRLAVDTVSMLLIALTVFLGPICVLASFTAITERPKTYYSWLLILQAAMTGVFCARDVIVFYIFFEFTLVPLYILINLYGSTNRRAAATKFFLYTFTGSMITLAGIVYVAQQYAAAHHGEWSFVFSDLASAARQMTFRQQAWVFWAMLAGFAVKVPLFPVHTWLPVAHTEAPTAGSVILAGVLLKLGTYGIYRFVLAFVPGACVFYAPTLAVLAIIGILYAGLICWVQTDVKKLVAYSSVSHLGYCVLGLFALNSIGLTGSILYMLNHGLSTGALFLLIGMMYERYHTRSLKELGGLASKMPVWATFMVFFAMASVGLPGLNGFVSEVMCILGTFQSTSYRFYGLEGRLPGATPGELGPMFAFAAGVGIIITAMYLLYMLGKICFGPLKEPAHHAEAHAHGHGTNGAHASASHAGVLPRDLSAREIGLLIPVAALCLFLGVYPQPVLNVLERPVAEVAAAIDEARQNPPQDAPGALQPQTAQARAAVPVSAIKEGVR